MNHLYLSIIKNMKSVLQQRLLSYLEDLNISIDDLEKKAGLKKSSVKNIIYGYSKKPSAENIQAIARALSCTMEDLMDPISLKNATSYDSKNKIHRLDIELYSKVSQAVINIIIKNNHIISLHRISYLIKESYTYIHNNNMNALDEHFINYLINKEH